MFQRWSKYLGAILALVLVSILSLLIIVVGANFLQSFAVYVLKDAAWTDLHGIQASYTVRSIMNFYYVTCGILFLGFFIFMEHQLITTGIPQKLVLRRGAFALGVELLILALFQGAMMTYMPVFPLQAGLAVLEALLGIGLILFARRKAAISRG